MIVFSRHHDKRVRQSAFESLFAFASRCPSFFFKERDEEEKKEPENVQQGEKATKGEEEGEEEDESEEEEEEEEEGEEEEENKPYEIAPITPKTMRGIIFNVLTEQENDVALHGQRVVSGLIEHEISFYGQENGWERVYRSFRERGSEIRGGEREEGERWEGEKRRESGVIVKSHQEIKVKLQQFLRKLRMSQLLSPSLQSSSAVSFLFCSQIGANITASSSSSLSLSLFSGVEKRGDEILFRIVQDILMDIRIPASSRWVYQPLLLFGFCALMGELCDALSDYYRFFYFYLFYFYFLFIFIYFYLFLFIFIYFYLFLFYCFSFRF